MVIPALAHSRVRFGVFELDLQAGQLRKSGVLVHLPPQPFKVLSLLVDRPNELITREELRKEVWGSETFVDFEHGLNFAIKKIRDALGDDAATPRYVETIPRRGYRFVAPVEAIAAESRNVERNGPPAGEPATPQSSRKLRRHAGVFIVTGVVVALLTAVFALNLGRARELLLARIHGRITATLPRIESLAVLPLENLSRDPEQEYFADGLTDTLITDLGQVSALRVISRTSVMHYKGVKKPLPQIANELNVDAVIEGTVQRSGGHVRITAQLLDARKDRHLWAQTFDRDFEDVIRLEKQTAIAIAHEVTGRLTPAEEARVARSTTSNPRAYDAYLRGRYLWSQRREAPVSEAVGYFEQALREDPNFALAFSGLADCYSVAWWSKTDNPRAETYARKALALEPDLAEGHASLGIAEAYQQKFVDSEKELKRALVLNPNYTMAHHWWSLQLLYFGRLQEALAENDRARQLDPFSLPVNHLRVAVLIALREYDRAVEQAETEAAIEPQSDLPHLSLARVYWIQSRVPQALDQERTAATLLRQPGRLDGLEEVAAVFSKSGPHAAALRSAQLKERRYKSDFNALEIAYQYGLAGDTEKALEWVNRAFPERLGDLYFGGWTAPEFDLVRSDPRYRELLRRMGLPEQR
jgi:TolB-like protein/DNA-binding winged helix-turn-helix (wHTH) protein